MCIDCRYITVGGRIHRIAVAGNLQILIRCSLDIPGGIVACRAARERLNGVLLDELGQLLNRRVVIKPCKVLNSLIILGADLIIVRFSSDDIRILLLLLSEVVIDLLRAEDIVRHGGNILAGQFFIIISIIQLLRSGLKDLRHPCTEIIEHSHIVLTEDIFTLCLRIALDLLVCLQCLGIELRQLGGVHLTEIAYIVIEVLEGGKVRLRGGVSILCDGDIDRRSRRVSKDCDLVSKGLRNLLDGVPVMEQRVLRHSEVTLLRIRADPVDNRTSIVLGIIVSAHSAIRRIIFIQASLDGGRNRAPIFIATKQLKAVHSIHIVLSRLGDDTRQIIIDGSAIDHLNQIIIDNRLPQIIDGSIIGHPRRTAKIRCQAVIPALCRRKLRGLSTGKLPIQPIIICQEIIQHRLNTLTLRDIHARHGVHIRILRVRRADGLDDILGEKFRIALINQSLCLVKAALAKEVGEDLIRVISICYRIINAGAVEEDRQPLRRGQILIILGEDICRKHIGKSLKLRSGSGVDIVAKLTIAPLACPSHGHTCSLIICTNPCSIFYFQPELHHGRY